MKRQKLQEIDLLDWPGYGAIDRPSQEFCLLGHSGEPLFSGGPLYSIDRIRASGVVVRVVILVEGEQLSARDTVWPYGERGGKHASAIY